MHTDPQNIKSVTDAVSVIHALRFRAHQGQDVSAAMNCALDYVERFPCNEVSDVIGLIDLANILVGAIRARAQAAGSTFGVDEAAQAGIYLDRAMTQLEFFVKNFQQRSISPALEEDFAWLKS